MRRRVIVLSVFSLALLPQVAPAQSKLTISNPIDLGDKVSVDRGKVVRDLDKILVPTVVLRVAVKGGLTVMNRGRFWETDGNTAKAKAKFVVGGLDKEYLQNLAKSLQDDYVARLREAGFTVLTWDDVKSNALVAEMKRYKPDEKYGMPSGGQIGTSNTYLMAFPSDEQAIDPPFQGYGWGFRKVMKELDAGLMVPEYTVDAPLLSGEKEHGITSRGASVRVFPEMTMRVMLPFNTAKGNGGWVTMKGVMGELADSIGVVGEAKDDSPEFANALSKSLSMLSGLGGIQSKSGIYGMRVDQPRYAEAVQRGGMSYHIAAAKALAAERK